MYLNNDMKNITLEHLKSISKGLKEIGAKEVMIPVPRQIYEDSLLDVWFDNNTNLGNDAGEKITFDGFGGSEKCLEMDCDSFLAFGITFHFKDTSANEG